MSRRKSATSPSPLSTRICLPAGFVYLLFVSDDGIRIVRVHEQDVALITAEMGLSEDNWMTLPADTTILATSEFS